ncbi:MAG: Pyruvate carboxyltransferase protein [Bacteroidota bacterium]|nr:Pyruvate carboxyltransferase protein [Bacteroidota bacterium]
MKEIIIHEVGLRDGLQMESEPVPTITKIQWIEELAASGIDIIQIGSFVNPAKVIQMADTDDLFNEMKQSGNFPENVILSGLVLNERGLERGMKCGVGMFCMGVSASDTHSRKNTGMATEEAIPRIINMAKEASAAGKRVQVSVQSAFGCGFEGKIPDERTLSIVEQYLEAGIKNISLADTAGHANPAQVERLFGTILEREPTAELACHFHNTYGMGLANVYAAMKTGVKFIETAFGGLGGCPFTKQPSGNVCTEDFVHFLQNMGIRQDVKLDSIIKVAKHASGFFIKDLPGYVYKTGGIKYL